MTTRTLAAVPAPAAPGVLALELRAMLALAMPLVLTQLTQVLVHTTEVLLLGRLGASPLAAASLAAALFHTALMFGVGVVSATAPIIAQAKGARQPRRIRRAVRQGLWVTILVTAPLMLLLWHARPLLAWMGQSLELLPMTEAYMRTAIWGLPFAVGFIVLRSFTAAFDRTRAVLLATLTGLVINVPLSWALIFGKLGLPPLGTAGAGIGVAVTFAATFLVMLAYCVRVAPFRRYLILARFGRPDWTTFREIFRIGLPIGAAVLMEVGLFAGSSLLMGLLGTAELAAHQVALQLASIAFMVPLGISHAATIRVGLAIGEGDPARARLAGWVACGLGAAFMCTMALLFWTMREPLVGLFLDGADAENAAALVLAAAFLRIGALFQLVDGLQVIGLACLRGLKDTTIPMWLAGLGYWVVGFPVCVLLGFHTPLGGVGIWIGFAVALATVAVTLLWRFHRLTRRIIEAALPPEPDLPLERGSVLQG